jgi:hypothetical protein
MKYIITISIIILISCIGFKNISNDLVGKWECNHKELKNGITKSTDLFSEEEFEYSCDGLIIELKSDFTGSHSIGDLNYFFKYKINDSILELGTRSYIIEKLTKTELIIRDYDSDGTNISNFRQKFKKIE